MTERPCRADEGNATPKQNFSMLENCNLIPAGLNISEIRSKETKIAKYIRIKVKRFVFLQQFVG